MFKEVLQSVDSNTYYAVAALIIFVLAFLSVLLWTWKLDNGLVEEMRSIPFSATDAENTGAISTTSANTSQQEDYV